MTLAQIEDYLINRIKAAFNGRLKAVESLPADWDSDTFKRLLRMAPGAFVVFGGGAHADRNTGASIDGRFSVIAVTAHASGELVRRRGDSREIGAYEIVEIAVPLLHEHTIPDVGMLKLTGVDNLFTGELDRQGAAVYAATFSLPITFAPTLDPATLDDFLTFHADYDLAPTDTAIDATDTVTLEGP